MEMGKKNTLYAHIKQNNIHDYSIYAVNELNNFGFLTIPKSGSTNFKTYFNLNKFEAFENRNHDKIYAALRNPYERFLSGILESLKRSYYLEKPMCGRDIPVSKEIYNQILNFKIDKPLFFLNQFTDFLKSYGYYDPHLEPQYYFLFDESGKAISEINLFPLKDMSSQIKKIAIENNIEMRLNKNYHSRSNESKFFFGETFKIELNDLRELDNIKIKNKFVIEYEHPFNSGLNLNFSKKYLVINNEYIEYKISKYYKRKILNIDLNMELKTKISELYKKDLILYEKLLKEYSGDAIKLSKLINNFV